VIAARRIALRPPLLWSPCGELAFAPFIEPRRFVFYSFPDHCQCGKQQSLH
jgi:hypothetical protein